MQNSKIEKVENIIGNFETAQVDSEEGKKRRNVATNALLDFAQTFVGNPKGFAEEAQLGEKTYKEACTQVLIAVYDESQGRLPENSLTEDQAILALNLGEHIEALKNDPKAPAVIKDLRKRLEAGKSIRHGTGLRDGRGKELYFITNSYKSMKSSILAALKRGETNLIGMTKAELAEGKAAVKARSVVTADTLNAAKAKLDAQADANGFVFNPATGKYEAIVATAA